MKFVLTRELTDADCAEIAALAEEHGLEFPYAALEYFMQAPGLLDEAELEVAESELEGEK